MYRGGLVFAQMDSSSRGNTDSLGVTVPGDFTSGGPPITSTDSSHATWTWKNVVQSDSQPPLWIAGFTLSKSSAGNREAPNAFGWIQFESLQGYADALAGHGTGTWFSMQGNGLAKYSSVSAAPFVQKQLVHSPRLVVTGGLRGDYQSGFGVMISPRISAATLWRGFVFRAGGGLFARNLPNNIFMHVIQNDAFHLRQFMAPGVSFADIPEAQSFALSAIHSRFAEDLTRPREVMQKASVERPLGRFTPGFEYTWIDGGHLPGSRRIADGNGWVDMVESNRSSETHRLHTQVVFKFGAQRLMAYHEWSHSRDNTDGPFSFPARQNDLRSEWARSTGIAPHNIVLAGSLRLPAAISLTLTDTWRSSAPYDLTTGLDAANNGLYNDRGTLARNSGNGPAFNSLGFYSFRRIPLPRVLHAKSRIYLNLGVQGDNLLNNKNFVSMGSVIGSPTFGQPLAALPGRSIRLWTSIN